MSSPEKGVPVIFPVLLVTGTTVGAGILALPIQTGLSGVFPALIGVVIAWLAMLLTGLIISESYLKVGDYSLDLLSLYKREIGSHVQWIVIPVYLLFFYGITVAYLSASSTILASLIKVSIPSWVFLLLFFLPSSLVVLFGMKLIHRANTVFMLMLGVAFVTIIVLSAKQVETARYLHMDWAFLPSVMPIVLCSFTFQCIVPTICRNLAGDKRKIRQAMLIGTAIPLVLYVLWIVVVVGALPVVNDDASILRAFERNDPATIPLAIHLKSNIVTIAGLIFSIAAIFTSYIAICESLRHFLTDWLDLFYPGPKKILVILLTFLPPVAITLIYPSLFLKALNLVGGVAVVLLFGFMPTIILWKVVHQKKNGKNSNMVRRVVAYALLLLFSVLFILELAQEFGWLKIRPEVENWHHRGFDKAAETNRPVDK